MSESALGGSSELTVPSAPGLGPAASGDARRVVRALSAVTFLEWFGASVGLPLLPVYLQHRGGSSVTIGLVVAAYFAAGVLFQYPAGRLVDRVGPARVMRIGLVVFALGGLSLALPLMPQLYIISRILQGAGAGSAEVAALAMVGAVVPAGQRGRAFASIYGTQLSGMAVGPLVGSLIGAFSVSSVYVAGGLIALLAGIPLALLGPQAPAAAAAADELPDLGDDGAGLAAAASRLNRRVLIGAVLVAAAFGLTVGVYETCWTLLLTERGASEWQIGLSWTLFALPFVLTARPAGRLADTQDRRVICGVGLIGALACCAIYPFLPSLVALLLLGGVEAAATAFAIPAVQSLLSQGTHVSRIGRAQGLFATSETATTALAAGVAGSLFAVRSWLPFVAGAVIGTALIAALPVVWAAVAGRATAEPAEAAG